MDGVQGAWPTAQVQAAAESLLRVFGGAVTLRFVSCADGGDVRQLGLTQRTVDDVRVAPALMQDVRGTQDKEVLVARGTLRGEMDTRGVNDSAGLFDVVSGVLIGEKLWRRVSVSADMIAGAEFMYRIRLRE